MRMEMRVIEEEEDETPSWLSIITKAKRFTAHVQKNNGTSSPHKQGQGQHTLEDPPSHDPNNVGGTKNEPNQQTPTPLPAKVKPKKRCASTRVRIPSSSSFSVCDISPGCGSGSGFNSSSPSPGVISCGSASSAEDDTSSVSTTMSTLSAFSSFSSPSTSPKREGGGSVLELIAHSSGYHKVSCYDDDEFDDPLERRGHKNNYGHINRFQDFRDKLPEISVSPLPLPVSNRISVIKSTRSFLLRDSQGAPPPPCIDCGEEPQDLSLKPKRFIACSSYTPPHCGSTEPFSRVKLIDEDEEVECVQDLSLRVRSSFNNKITKTTPTKMTKSLRREATIIMNSRPNSVRDEHHVRPNNMAKLSSLICSGTEASNSNSTVKFEQSDDSTSSVGSFAASMSSLISNNSNHSNSNNINVRHVSSGMVQEDEGDLVIVDVDVDCIRSNMVDTRKNCIERPLIQPEYNLLGASKPQTNGQIHDPKNNTSTKETDPETEVDVEVKSRRGRKRKDEEAIGTRFDCFLCSFTSVKENVLRNHMNRMHTVKGNRGNVKCTVCGYSCPSLDELRSHQELIHGKEAAKEDGKPIESKVAFHACHHCTKKFRSRSQLEAHLRLIAQKQLWKDLKNRRIVKS